MEIITLIGRDADSLKSGGGGGGGDGEDVNNNKPAKTFPATATTSVTTARKSAQRAGPVTATRR